MKNVPFSFNLEKPDFIPAEYDNHIKRKLSNMAEQYQDQEALDKMLSEEDSVYMKCTK